MRQQEVNLKFKLSFVKHGERARSQTPRQKLLPETADRKQEQLRPVGVVTG